jgi:hypothetical protein
MRVGGTKCGIEGTGLSGAETETRLPRKWLEAAGWVVLVSVLWGADLLAKISERNQTGIGKDDFRLISEQVTSAIAVLVMILFVVRWLKLFPLRRDAWVPAIIGHTAGSIIFAFGHHALMVVMRIVWYRINGIHYIWREPFVANLITEYQKDIKVYLGILLVASAWQLYRRSHMPDQPQAPERLVVQTGSGKSVLRFEQIDYLEGARNYVSVYAEGREYIVRKTMTELMQELSAGPFARSHRSFIVNVDKIEEIRAVDSKLRILLKTGQEIPLSRGYRDEFDARIAGGTG